MLIRIIRFPDAINKHVAAARLVKRRHIQLAMPIMVDAEPEPRNRTYGSRCHCKMVYRLSAESMQHLRDNRLLVDEDVAVPVCVCECMVDATI